MPKKVKTIVTWLVVAFLVYAVVRNPDRAAGVIRWIVGLIYETVVGFSHFFESLAT